MPTHRTPARLSGSALSGYTRTGEAHSGIPPFVHGSVFDFQEREGFQAGTYLGGIEEIVRNSTSIPLWTVVKWLRKISCEVETKSLRR